MQKIWQQAKRIIIFLSLWAIVTGLTASAVFALFNYFASDEQRTLFKNMKLEAYLSKYVPKEMFVSGVSLVTKWCFPLKGKHNDGDYRTTKPDTDNLQKLLKDVMTKLGFWKDDALVCSELVEKFWADIPGIYIRIKELPVNGHFSS